ncbi:hypothetical protein [Promicromonospora sp. NPDC050262]|uniref:hypothetical protein n=1 Tax=Promicromonospora sp. NPDC050262 TaxID=3155036 RepID=UPI0033DDA5AE
MAIASALLRPDLWNALLPALTSGREAGRRYVSSGKFVPRQSVTKYEENDAGWPQTVANRTTPFSRDSDPVDWGELFSLREGTLSYVLTKHVPELDGFLNETSRRALSDEHLMHGLSIVAPYFPDDDQESQIQHEMITRLIGPILNRADAIGAEDEDSLREIYRSVEMARFADKLTGDVVMPLVAVSFDAPEPVRIDSNIWIEPLSKADQMARAMDWSATGSVSPWVSAAATHAVVIRAVTFDNVVQSLSVLRGQLPEGFGVVDAEIAAEAVTIVTGKPTGHCQVLVRPHGWASGWAQDLPPLWEAWTGRAYPEILNRRNDWDGKFDPISSEQTEKIAKVAGGLRSAPKNIKVAARRCRRSSFRDEVEDMVLDAAIGIEALVGKEADAVTHRLAQRTAVALRNKLPPEVTYDVTKRFYGIRSTVAHGGTPKRWDIDVEGTEYPAVDLGKILLRSLLMDWLLAEIPWDATSLDRQMLQLATPPDETDDPA